MCSVRLASTRSIQGHDCTVSDDGSRLVASFRLVASQKLPLELYILMKEAVFTTFLRFAKHECYPRTGSGCRDLYVFLSVKRTSRAVENYACPFFVDSV